MAKNNLIKIIILVIVVGALGFYGGMLYQKNQRGNFSGGSFQRFSTGANQQAGRQGTSVRSGGFASGEITSIDNNTITIKTQDGSSKLVVYSDSTKVNKTSEGSKSDLKVGEKITAIGSESSGMITAQNIAIGNGMLQMGAPGRVQSGQDGQQPPAATQQ